jgi:hypothetical protein
MNIDITKLDKYPLMILVGGALFTTISISNGGFFFKESVFIFAYGILSSIARQIRKDVKDSSKASVIYHVFQLVLFVVVAILFLFLFVF